MNNQVLFWVLFHVLIAGVMAFDLGAFGGQKGEMSTRTALKRVALYVSMALAFNVGLYFWRDRDSVSALQFLSGYLIELSLSVDNLFVFILIFTYFRVPAREQQIVLFWGIIGALFMRAAFILVGIELIHRFEIFIALFGFFLIYTGIKMMFHQEEEVHPERNPVLKIIRRFIPITPDYHGNKFFVRLDGFMMATPLFLVLVVVETTDLIFAVDSIPAILGITQDRFIAYTSNVFAILGLRALYFALAGVMNLFHLLKYGLAFILAFIGVKMVVAYFFHYHLPIVAALGIVVSVLAVSVVASLIWPAKEPDAVPLHPGEGGEVPTEKES